MSKLSPATTRDPVSAAVPLGPLAVVVSILGLLAVAACLRPPITSFGPVVSRVAAETGLGAAQLGLLGALPVIGFAVVSPFVAPLARRLGDARTVLCALLVLGAGLALRFVPALPALWVGTALVGVGIAVGNVLLPALVKHAFPARLALVTGLYTAVMGAFAALGSGLSVPIAEATGSWRLAIGCWLAVALVALAAWIVRMRTASPRAGGARSATGGGAPGGVRAAGGVGAQSGVGARGGVGPSVWRSPTAWCVTAFMGLQSTGFYVTVTWLPSIEIAAGVPERAAGWHLFLCQLVGICAGLLVATRLGRSSGQRAIAASAGGPLVVACIGLVLAPGAVVLWVVLIGISQGATLTIALALIGFRSGSPADTARLSGMAQGVGYGLAALGPVAAGLLHDAFDAWEPVLWFVVAVTVVQSLAALGAGRPVTIGHDRTEVRA